MSIVLTILGTLAVFLGVSFVLLTGMFGWATTDSEFRGRLACLVDLGHSVLGIFGAPLLGVASETVR